MGTCEVPVELEPPTCTCEHMRAHICVCTYTCTHTGSCYSGNCNKATLVCRASWLHFSIATVLSIDTLVVHVWRYSWVSLLRVIMLLCIVMLPFYLLFLHNGLLSLNAFYPKKQAEWEGWT